MGRPGLPPGIYFRLPLIGCDTTFGPPRVYAALSKMESPIR
jgi:hypothetical protein